MIKNRKNIDTKLSKAANKHGSKDDDDDDDDDDGDDDDSYNQVLEWFHCSLSAGLI